MASNRSTNQRVVRAFSILTLIVGALTLALALVAFFGGAAIVAETGVDVVETTGGLTGTTTQFVRFGALILIANAVLILLEGFCGLRASNDATKAMPYLILSVVSLAFSVYNLVANYDPTLIGSVVLNAVNAWCAFRVRQEGQQY